MKKRNSMDVRGRPGWVSGWLSAAAIVAAMGMASWADGVDEAQAAGAVARDLADARAQAMRQARIDAWVLAARQANPELSGAELLRIREAAEHLQP